MRKQINMYLTAYADNSTVERAKGTAPSGYIIKPFEEVALKTTLEMSIHKGRIMQRIRESERRYRTLIDMSPDAIFHTDLEANFLTINKKCAELFGFDSTDEMMQSVQDPFLLIAPEERDRVRNSLAESVEKGGESNVEYRLCRKDGTHFEADVSTAILLKEDGSPEGFIITARDSTERKRIEEELNKTQLILLALLVSFVTSIATGIVTVALMEQAPPGVTRTINQVVEKTIEIIQPGEETIIVHETVIRESELIRSAVQKNLTGLVVFYITEEAESDKSRRDIGSGFLVTPDGMAVIGADILKSMIDRDMFAEYGNKIFVYSGH